MTILSLPAIKCAARGKMTMHVLMLAQMPLQTWFHGKKYLALKAGCWWADTMGRWSSNTCDFSWAHLCPQIWQAYVLCLCASFGVSLGWVEIEGQVERDGGHGISRGKREGMEDGWIKSVSNRNGVADLDRTGVEGQVVSISNRGVIGHDHGFNLGFTFRMTDWLGHWGFTWCWVIRCFPTLLKWWIVPQPYICVLGGQNRWHWHRCRNNFNVFIPISIVIACVWTFWWMKLWHAGGRGSKWGIMECWQKWWIVNMLWIYKDPNRFCSTPQWYLGCKDSDEAEWPH